ncbi:MAG: glycerol kinase, partial [Planctomycetaceae bacterium]|nr:glycerol kinase [Planctomycetaceae bacterium]
VADGLGRTVAERTGLVIDAYFSATKVAWLLDHIEGLRSRAERGEILFGTVDSFLIWRLTGGRLHAIDPSNASRTLLFNLHTLDWDDELLKLFGIPRCMLPEVVPSSGQCGVTDPALFGREIPIAGIAGDQQAATFGQGCFGPGDAKNTYGTGSFVLMNAGSRPVTSSQGLLTTVGWQIGEDVVYCLEGSIFITGAAVQWLRDGLQIISTAAEIESLAEEVPDSGGVCFVPALTGLGAPHWDPSARGLLIGMTRGTTRAHIARATLEAIAFQTRDVLEAMRRDAGIAPRELNVDGGGSANNLLMQLQADQLQLNVRRPVVQETTALGAAFLAGLATGVWDSLHDVTRCWQLDREFTPRENTAAVSQQWEQWQRAVQLSRGWASAASPD